MAVVLLVAGEVSARTDFPGDESFELAADVIEYQHPLGIYIAEGDVRVSVGERRLRADWVAFSNETKRGVAAGDIQIQDGEQIIEAELIEFDIDSLTGLIFYGYFDTGVLNFRLWADEMERVDKARYAMDGATFTTCRCEDPGVREPWSIRSGQTDVEIGGYGFTRHMTFRVLGIPVIYLPWMFFPVKTDRESGLLFPEFGYGGRYGFEFGIPIFWAARRNINVTLTPTYMTERGAKPYLDVHAVWGKTSYVRVMGTGLYDEGIRPDSAAYPFSAGRWAVTGDLFQELPKGWGLRADLNLVSDNQYVEDFDDIPGVRRYRFLESPMFAFGKLTGDGALYGVGSAVYANDLMNPDDRDRDSYMLQRAPHLNLDWLPSQVKGLGRLVAGMDTDYVYFTAMDEVDELFAGYISADGHYADVGIESLQNEREDRDNPGSTADFNMDDFAAFQGPEANGSFEEGEPLTARGHRVDLRPRIAMPFNILDSVELYPEVGYLQRLYFTESSDFQEQGVITGRVDLRTRMWGRFKWPLLPPTRHLIEPRVRWALTDNRGASDALPIFVPRSAVPARLARQLALDNVVLDFSDRIPDANILEFGFGNRFYAGPRSDLKADIDVSVAYDFETERWNLIAIDGSTFPYRGWRTRFNFGWDIDAGSVEQALMEFFAPMPRVGLLDGNFFATYRYRRDAPQFFEDFVGNQRFEHYRVTEHVSQVDFGTTIRIGDHWRLRYHLGWSLDQNILVTNGGGIDYMSRCKCWALGIYVRDDRNRGARVQVAFNLLGLGDSSANPFASGMRIGSSDF